MEIVDHLEIPLIVDNSLNELFSGHRNPDAAFVLEVDVVDDIRPFADEGTHNVCIYNDGH